MTIQSRQEALNYFGKRLINYRDLTIRQSFKTIEGEMKSSKCQKLYTQLSDFNEKQKEALYDLIINVTDNALNHCLELFEQEKEVVINLMIVDKPANIKEISRRICNDYWNFVDDFSNQRRL